MHGKIPSWYLWVGFHCKWFCALGRLPLQIVPYFCGSLDDGWCRLPRKVSMGERGNGGISWDITTCLSTYVTRTKDLLILGIMFLITTSGMPVSQPCPHMLPDWGGLALLVGGHCVRILICLLVPCSASAADNGFVSMESSWPRCGWGAWWSPGNFRLLFLSGFL